MLNKAQRTKIKIASVGLIGVALFVLALVSVLTVQAGSSRDWIAVRTCDWVSVGTDVYVSCQDGSEWIAVPFE